MSAHKILLVDDSKSARYALRLLLQKHNFDVDTAESAESALEKVKDELPDAIFMDHLMPGMNGFEALEVLKGNPDTARIPVVMCTSNDDEPYQIEARDKGALGILPKPATPEKLNFMLESIDAAMAQSEAFAPAAPTAVVTSAPATPAMDKAAISALISDELNNFMDNEIRPALGETLDRRLDEMQSSISENVLGRSAAQIEQWMETETARAREALSTQHAATEADHEDFSAQFETGFKALKEELVRMQTDHAQALVEKVSSEVLPDLIRKNLDQVQQRLYEQLDQRLEGLADRLVESVPDNDQVIRRISEVAETVAEHKAVEVAVAHAQEVVESSEVEKTSEMSSLLLNSAESNERLVYIVGTVAAGIGVLSSVLVYFLAG